MPMVEYSYNEKEKLERYKKNLRLQHEKRQLSANERKPIMDRQKERKEFRSGAKKALGNFFFR